MRNPAIGMSLQLLLSHWLTYISSCGSHTINLAAHSFIEMIAPMPAQFMKCKLTASGCKNTTPVYDSDHDIDDDSENKDTIIEPDKVKARTWGSQ